MKFGRLPQVFPVLLVSILCPWLGVGAEPTHVAQPASDAPVPKGMVAFFAATGCPQGWEPAPKAAGRVVIGTIQADAVGETQGEALQARDLPRHAHGYDLTSVLTSLNYIRGSTLLETVEPGVSIRYTGESTTSDLRLPFLQLPACREERP